VTNNYVNVSVEKAYLPILEKGKKQKKVEVEQKEELTKDEIYSKETNYFRNYVD